MNEFHFTEAEKEQIQHATHHAMSDTLRQLYPLFEKVCGERIAALKDEVERLKLRGYVCAACNYPCRENVPCMMCALRERLKELEAENARLSAPVSDEEWNFDDRLLPSPELREMFDRMRLTINQLIAARKQGA